MSLSCDMDITWFIGTFAQRQRTQANGKTMEDGHALHVDSAKNGA